MPPNPLLALGDRWTFVGGKGGVGKTTTAAALGIARADAGERVLVLSTDPAHSLGDALGVPLGPEPVAIAGVPRLRAFEVDSATEHDRVFGEHREVLASLLEAGTVLDRADAGGLLDLALPGMDELAALLRLLQLARSPEGERVIVDTAPTGHTLRLLRLPRLARDWLAALDAMEDRQRIVAEAFAGIGRPGPAAVFLDDLRSDLDRFAALLTDPAQTRFILVTTPEPLVAAETRRYADALRAEGIALGGLVVNRSGTFPNGAGGAEEEERAVVPEGTPVVHVPVIAESLRGTGGLRRYAAALLQSGGATSEAGEAGPDKVAVGNSYTPPRDRQLYVVGGKGGVGKSTVAAALAVRLAEVGGRVLLFSTDPAGSLGDLFGTAAGGDALPAPGAPGLELLQVDAAGAWKKFRERYQTEIDALFSGGGAGLISDRRVLERLLDLAPPGLDELMALVQVVDFTGLPSYDALVLDSAPTGHLLRLLELPSVGIEWTHALLRLLLKYREVVGLGSAAEHVLELARLLRGLRARLEDPRETLMLVVARPESLSVPETARLIPRLGALGIPPGVLLVNRLFNPAGAIPPRRAGDARRLLDLGGSADGVGAPEWEQGPRGADELRRFASSWRRIAEGGGWVRRRNV